MADQKTIGLGLSSWDFLRAVLYPWLTPGSQEQPKGTHIHTDMKDKNERVE